MSTPLMPKATAVWLVENTGLTFAQIAAFCGMHPLEVQGIADGEVAIGIVGIDPVAAGQLTAEEIKRCEADPKARLEIAKRDIPSPLARAKGARYTPVAKRQDRPDAIAWLLKVHPELQDSQVAKLVGSTKSTVQSVRDRSHWNMQNVRPRDPVTLGLCSLKDLNDAVDKARRKAAREDAAKKKAAAAFAKADPTAAVKVTDASGGQEIEVRKTKENDYYAKSSIVEGIHKVTSTVGEGLDKGMDDLRNKKLFDFGFEGSASVARELVVAAAFIHLSRRVSLLNPTNVEQALEIPIQRCRAKADPPAAEALFRGMTPAILKEMVRGSPEVDLAVYLEPAFAAAFASALDEGFLRGPDGYARDTLLAMQRWPFDPAEIRPAVHLWYGRFDASPFHSLDFGASLARRIPGAARTVVEGAGGSILWTHGTEIIEALLEARHRAGT
jgi:hypothetical protein